MEQEELQLYEEVKKQLPYEHNQRGHFKINDAFYKYFENFARNVGISSRELSAQTLILGMTTAHLSAINVDTDKFMTYATPLYLQVRRIALEAYHKKCIADGTIIDFNYAQREVDALMGALLYAVDPVGFKENKESTIERASVFLCGKMHKVDGESNLIERGKVLQYIEHNYRKNKMDSFMSDARARYEAFTERGMSSGTIVGNASRLTRSYLEAVRRAEETSLATDRFDEAKLKVDALNLACALEMRVETRYATRAAKIFRFVSFLRQRSQLKDMKKALGIAPDVKVADVLAEERLKNILVDYSDVTEYEEQCKSVDPNTVLQTVTENFKARVGELPEPTEAEMVDAYKDLINYELYRVQKSTNYYAEENARTMRSELEIYLEAKKPKEEEIKPEVVEQSALSDDSFDLLFKDSDNKRYDGIVDEDALEEESKKEEIKAENKEENKEENQEEVDDSDRLSVDSTEERIAALYENEYEDNPIETGRKIEELEKEKADAREQKLLAIREKLFNSEIERLNTDLESKKTALDATVRARNASVKSAELEMEELKSSIGALEDKKAIYESNNEKNSEELATVVVAFSSYAHTRVDDAIDEQIKSDERAKEEAEASKGFLAKTKEFFFGKSEDPKGTLEENADNYFPDDAALQTLQQRIVDLKSAIDENKIEIDKIDGILNEKRQRLEMQIGIIESSKLPTRNEAIKKKEIDDLERTISQRLAHKDKAINEGEGLGEINIDDYTDELEYKLDMEEVIDLDFEEPIDLGLDKERISIVEEPDGSPKEPKIEPSKELSKKLKK